MNRFLEDPNFTNLPPEELKKLQSKLRTVGQMLRENFENEENPVELDDKNSFVAKLKDKKIQKRNEIFVKASASHNTALLAILGAAICFFLL